MKRFPILVGLAVIFLSGCSEFAGPQGPPGNANVVTLTLRFIPARAAVNGSVASTQYRVPEVTPAVADLGAVLAYFRDQGTWTALPFTIGVEDKDDPVVDYSFTLGYAYEEALVEVFIESSTGDEAVWDDIVTQLEEEYRIKVVVIHGFAAQAGENIDFSDYEAVMHWYGIEEYDE